MSPELKKKWVKWSQAYSAAQKAADARIRARQAAALRNREELREHASQAAVDAARKKREREQREREQRERELADDKAYPVGTWWWVELRAPYYGRGGYIVAEKKRSSVGSTQAWACGGSGAEDDQIENDLLLQSVHPIAQIEIPRAVRAAHAQRMLTEADE